MNEKRPDRKVVLVLGQTGTGKSTLTKIIRKKFHRVITLDPMEEYEGQVMNSYDEFIDFFLNEPPRSFNLVLRFTSEEEILFTFRSVWEIQDVLFVAEEIEQYLDPRDPDEDFDRLISFGRHHNIHLLGISRRFVEISTKFRAQCTSIFTFKQFLKRDLDALEDMGFDPEQVKALENVKYPNPPINGTNFLTYGEPYEQIEFRSREGKKVIPAERFPLP
jgi:hypothetical protein